MLKKVLIVDDNIVNRMILASSLHNDYEIVEASNGSDAIDILKRDSESISAVLLDIVMHGMDGYDVLKQIRNNDATFPIPVIMVTGSEAEASREKALTLGANDFVTKPYNSAVIKHCLRNAIALRETSSIVDTIQKDKLTGLYNREAFFDFADKMIKSRNASHYIMSCLDIDNFKLINEQYGTEEGDRILKELGRVFNEDVKSMGGIAARISADNYACIFPAKFKSNNILQNIQLKRILVSDRLPISLSIGRCVVTNCLLSANAYYDRACIAKRSVKGRYDTHIAYFDDIMLDKLVRTQNITTEMNSALASGKFEIWFQPQYNHTTGALVGSEALVRWRHPERGIISPSEFIPVFEQNGFIYELDKYVWEQVCIYMRRWLDEEKSSLPVSVNISRYDLFRPDLSDVISALVKKYNIPENMLRLEITESAFTEAVDLIVKTVKQLVSRGFIVEIDDFGSGYSSLNTLKNVPAQVLKLDMRFLENDADSQRGGSILESIVRMTKWLGMTIVAEGVEDRAQADFLKSIGCNYVQGYLYARPMSATYYEALFESSDKEDRTSSLSTVYHLDSNAFWRPESMETLIFNRYVGSACIMEFSNGKVEMLRANDRFAKVFSDNKVGVDYILSNDFIKTLSKSSLASLKSAILLSMETDDEVMGEYVFVDVPNCPKYTYVRATLRVIASANDRFLVYCICDNITAQREAEKREQEAESKRRLFSNQLNYIIENIEGGVSASIIRKDSVDHLFINKKLYDIIGYSKEQLMTELPNILAVVHPADIELLKKSYSEASKTRSAFENTFRIIRRDGSVRWLQCNSSITDFPGINEPIHLIVTNDITERRENELEILRYDEQLRFLNEAAQNLLSQTDNEKALIHLLHRILEYFGGTRAYVFEFDYLSKVSDNTYEVCADGATSEIHNLQRIPFDTIPFWIHAFEKDNYLCIENVDFLDDSRKEKQILLDQGIKSLVAIPIMRGDVQIGFVGIDDPDKTVEIGRLEAIGKFIAVMLARRDASSRLMNERNVLKSFVDMSSCGFCRLVFKKDVYNSRIEYVNESFCRLAGMECDYIMKEFGSDFINRQNKYDGLLGFIHSDDLNILRDALYPTLLSGKESSRIIRIKRDGGYIAAKVACMNVGRRGDEVNVCISLSPVSDDALSAPAELSLNPDENVLTENIPVGILTFILSPDGTEVLYLNGGLCDIFKCDKEKFGEMIKTNPLSLVYEADCEIIKTHVGELYKNGAPVDLVFRICAEGGELKWVNFKAVENERRDGCVTINAVICDVTKRYEADDRLRISDAESRIAITHSGRYVFRFDVSERTLTASKDSVPFLSFSQVYKNVPEDQISQGLISPETADDCRVFIQSIIDGAESGSVIFMFKTPRGRCWLKAHFSTAFSSLGKPVSSLISFVDITERLEKESVYKKWQQYIIDKDAASYTLLRCNVSKDASFYREGGTLLPAVFDDSTLGFNGQTAEYAERYVFDEDRTEYYSFVNADSLLAGFLRGKRSVVFEYRECLDDGDIRWLRLTVDLIEYPNSSDIEAYLMYENIDDSKREELLTLERAQTDPLTGILNRAVFASKVDTIISRSRGAKTHALLMLDIDGFKLVNDFFGHSAGDQALIDIANSLRSAVRRDDLIARLGGDEFVVFLNDIPNDSVAANKAKQICALTRKSFSLDVQISGSVGIAVYPRDGADFDALYKKADNALYSVKDSGKDNYSFYHSGMTNRRLATEAYSFVPSDTFPVKKKRRMLIVDDSPVDIELLSNVFKGDFILDKAKDGRSALVRLRHYGSSISVVLLDLIMPEMDGFSVLKAMNESPELQNIPVVVVSSSNDKTTGLDAIKFGASDFVTKPVDADLLRVRVESAISKSENERLRAKNSLLELQSDESARYKTVLKNTGTVVIENDWLVGSFVYDPDISSHIAGVFDNRSLWHVLLSGGSADLETVDKMQKLVLSIAKDRNTINGSMDAVLKTPSGEAHLFNMNVYKQDDRYSNTNKLIITFNDTEK